MKLRGFVLAGILVACLASVAVADQVLVTAVQGNVTLEGIGRAKTVLEPFVRLNEGDRLSLPAASQVSLVFVTKGRQETWQGLGSVVLGEGESKISSGKPQLQVRDIPPNVARQMSRMPIVAADGKVGMMTLRKICDPTNFDREYAEMRAQTVATDVLPEVYLLAGLFECKYYDRVDEELRRASTAYPQDETMSALRQIYTRALAQARSPKSSGQ